jgi:multidrug resistance protein, MATE family
MKNPDSTDRMRLTLRNFASFSVAMLAIEFVMMGSGAVDLLMITPKGVDYVAAVGLADVIVLGVFSFFTGLVHVFGSRLAIAEGERSTARRLPILVAAGLPLVLAFQIVGLLASLVIPTILRTAGQDPRIIPLIEDYIDVRLYGILLTVVAACIGMALRTCGAKSDAVRLLILGFFANAGLNWVVLYTGAQRFFDSPSSAVAWSTVMAQGLMIPIGAWLLIRLLRRRREPLVRPAKKAVTTEFRSMSGTSCGLGGRLMNDYMSAVIPLLFIGTLGAETVAATAVAIKIYTLYCRVPQACFETSFIFYGYAYGSDRAGLLSWVRKLMAYSAVPTGISLALVVLAAPWLVAAFSGDGIDLAQSKLIFYASMISIPFYFFDQFFARMISVHQRGNTLFLSSLLAYVVTIPLAWWSVFQLESAFLAIASRGVANLIVGVAFWHLLQKYIREEQLPLPVSVPVR